MIRCHDDCNPTGRRVYTSSSGSKHAQEYKEECPSRGCGVVTPIPRTSFSSFSTRIPLPPGSSQLWQLSLPFSLLYAPSARPPSASQRPPEIQGLANTLTFSQHDKATYHFNSPICYRRHAIALPPLALFLDRLLFHIHFHRI